MRNVTPAATLAALQIATLPRIVAVVFPNSNTEYSYYCDIPEIKAGDYAVVASPYGPSASRGMNERFFAHEINGHPTVVRVVRTEETIKDVSKAAKWIIARVEIERYAERLAQEQKIEVIKAKIKRAKEEALERAQLASLRELSPELDLLITELANLTGVPVEKKPIPVRAHARKRTVSKGSKTTRSTGRKTKTTKK